MGLEALASQPEAAQASVSHRRQRHARRAARGGWYKSAAELPSPLCTFFSSSSPARPVCACAGARAPPCPAPPGFLPPPHTPPAPSPPPLSRARFCLGLELPPRLAAALSASRRPTWSLPPLPLQRRLFTFLKRGTARKESLPRPACASSFCPNLCEEAPQALHDGHVPAAGAGAAAAGAGLPARSAW